MAMTGVVHAINRKRGMVAIATESDGYIIIELLGDDEIEPGDEMAWTDEMCMGSEVFTNVTKRKKMDVIVQNLNVPKSLLQQQLLLR